MERIFKELKKLGAIDKGDHWDLVIEEDYGNKLLIPKESQISEIRRAIDRFFPEVQMDFNF